MRLRTETASRADIDLEHAMYCTASILPVIRRRDLSTEDPRLHWFRDDSCGTPRNYQPLGKSNFGSAMQ